MGNLKPSEEIDWRLIIRDTFFMTANKDPQKRKLADLEYEKKYLQNNYLRVSTFDPHVQGDELGILRANLLSLLSPNLDGEVLDYGAGLCEIAEYLAVSGAQVTAMDMFSGYLEASRNRSREYNNTALNYVIGDCEALPFSNNSFSAAVCSEVLHHVPDPNLGASELFRVIQPGGACLVVEPNALSPLRRVKELIVRRQEKIHEASFYPWELKKIFKSAGFEVASLPISKFKVRLKKRNFIFAVLYKIANGPIIWRVINDSLLLLKTPTA